MGNSSGKSANVQQAPNIKTNPITGLQDVNNLISNAATASANTTDVTNHPIMKIAGKAVNGSGQAGPKSVNPNANKPLSQLSNSLRAFNPQADLLEISNTGFTPRESQSFNPLTAGTSTFSGNASSDFGQVPSTGVNSIAPTLQQPANNPLLEAFAQKTNVSNSNRNLTNVGSF